jgi:hypothetical protein
MTMLALLRKWIARLNNYLDSLSDDDEDELAPKNIF